jgi:hypothetical protein
LLYGLILQCLVFNLNILPSESGSAKIIKWSGKTSGTPPTLVLTTNNPHEAASTIAMQNASVKEVFKNICPVD